MPKKIAFHPDNSAFVVLGEREILAHDTPTQTPLWHAVSAANIVGVAASRSSVFAVDENGQLLQWQWDSGDLVSEFPLGAPAACLTVNASGVVAVALPDRIVFVFDGARTSIMYVAGVTHLCWSPEGQKLASADQEGTVRVHFVRTSGVVSNSEQAEQVRVDRPVRDLAGCRDGWIVAAGNAVCKVSGSPLSARKIISNTPQAPQHVACTQNGALVAWSENSSSAYVLNVQSGQLAGSVGYPDCELTDLSFGPEAVLGISLSHGDANLLDLTRQIVARTDPYEGRPHHHWLLSPSFSPAQVPSSLLPPPPPKKSRKWIPLKERPIPSWLAPIIGPIVCVALAAKAVVRKADNPMDEETRNTYLIGAVVVGFVGGLFLWMWDRMAPKD